MSKLEHSYSDLVSEKNLLTKQYEKAKESLLRRKADAHKKILTGATVHAIFGRWLTKQEADDFIFCCTEFKKIFDRFLSPAEMSIFVKICQNPDNQSMFKKYFDKLNSKT